MKVILFFCIFIGILIVDLFIPEHSFLKEENSYYEALQYVILLYGFYFSLMDIKSDRKNLKELGWSGALLWIVVLGRENNWGRVFFSYDRTYKYMIAYPIATLFVIISLYNIIRYQMISKFFSLLKRKEISGILCITLLCFTFGSYLGEKIINSAFVEMSMEFFCYANLVIVVNQLRDGVKEDIKLVDSK